jgi:hypothetical protein
MTDNVILPATGETIAADVIGGAFFQRVKIAQGADGVNDGDVSTANPLPVKAPDVSTDVAISGVITVTTAGTAVQGGNVALTNGVYIRALSTNTGLAYVGNDGAGDVSSANGWSLLAGEMIVIQVANLSNLWFDTAVSGEKFCWLKA